MPHIYFEFKIGDEVEFNFGDKLKTGIIVNISINKKNQRKYSVESDNTILNFNAKELRLVDENTLFKPHEVVITISGNLATVVSKEIHDGLIRYKILFPKGHRSWCDENFIRKLDTEEENIKTEKPPLGLIPKSIYYLTRKRDISKAIQRYTDASVKIPQEWINEYNEIISKENSTKK